MATAQDMYTELQRLGHNYSPDKQAYLGTIAGQMVTLYDPNSLDRQGRLAAVSLRAEGLEGYVAKGFLFERPEAVPEAATPPAGEAPKRGRGKKAGVTEGPAATEPGPPGDPAEDPAAPENGAAD